MILETLNCVAGHKRKAGDAGLPDKLPSDDEKSVPPCSIVPFELGGNDLLMRTFESIWTNFLRPQLEHVYGWTPDGQTKRTRDADATSPLPLDDPAEPPLRCLESFAAQAQLDESCVLTQPYTEHECCAECTIAGQTPIDQFSDDE